MVQRLLMLLWVVTLSGPARHLLLLLLLVGGVEASYAQEEKGQFIRKGLLRSMATISPGKMTYYHRTSTISLHGCFEYYASDNISIRGNTYYLLEAKDVSYESYVFEFNHSIFSGAAYHFRTSNHIDPYISFEPGIAITKRVLSLPCQLINYASCESIGNTSVNPIISSALGFNYYFQKWFHMFGEARYIHGKHLSDATTPLSLSELRFSFGLGFNLNLLKKKE